MTGSWKVEIKAEAKKALLTLIKNGELSQGDVEILKKWVSEIVEAGIEAIKDSPFWNDHELHSEWKGYRSSSFSFKGRIIYRVIGEKVLVKVVRITVDHDYGR